MLKIAIIGAGPAGLSAAVYLSQSQKNHIIHIYEKHKVGENIICGEGLFRNLNYELPDIMKVKRLIIMDQETIEINLPQNSSFVTFNRSEWQICLAEKAVKHGVKIFENFMISREHLPDLQKNYDYLLDGSGYYGVSHNLFPVSELKNYRKNLVPAFQLNLAGDFSCFEGVLIAKVFNEPPGYFWFFPRKKDNKICLANAGIGRLRKKKKMAGNIKEKLYKTVSEIVSHYNILTCKAAPIPTKRFKTFMSKNVILLGDALGLCSPLHGGGIDTAFFSGFYAAQSILKNNFKIYQDYLKNLDRRFFMERFILKLWDLFGSKAVLNRLKNKGLFSDSKEAPFSEKWLKKALIRMIH